MKYRPFSFKLQANRDSVSIQGQAHAAAAFYLQRGPGPIHVFPCKRTGHSVDFRSYLAAILSKGSLPYDKISLGNAEANCAQLGYTFVEVDPADYPSR